MTDPTGARSEDDGLSIDMIDADRLRRWAECLTIYGPDVSHWGSTTFLVEKMRAMADGIEQAVRDIGKLRAEALASRAAAPAKLHHMKQGDGTVCGAAKERGNSYYEWAYVNCPDCLATRQRRAAGEGAQP